MKAKEIIKQFTKVDPDNQYLNKVVVRKVDRAIVVKSLYYVIQIPSVRIAMVEILDKSICVYLKNRNALFFDNMFVVGVI